MPTVTRSRLRAILGAEDGFYFSSTTTSAGTTTTLVDTGVPRYDTSLLTNKWVLLTSGAASGESRRISSVSSSTITVTTAFSAAVASGVTYEILPWDPIDMNNALQEGGRIINGESPLMLVPSETLVVDNLIANFDFETGTFTSWSSVGSPTLTANTSYFVHGAQSANIAGAAGTGLTQNLLTVAEGFRSIDQAAGKTLQVRGWLRATDASNIRLRVTFNGSTYTNGPYHSGDDDWEGPNIHSISVTIPANATEMSVSIEKSTGVAAQADMVVAWIDRISRYTIPTTFVVPVQQFKVLQQTWTDRPRWDYDAITQANPPVAGRLLHLEGLGRLTVPSTDSGTVELDETRAELLVAYAGAYLHGTLQNVSSEPREVHQQLEARWSAKAAFIKSQVGISHEMLTHNRYYPWETKDESGTAYLYLLRR